MLCTRGARNGKAVRLSERDGRRTLEEEGVFETLVGNVEADRRKGPQRTRNIDESKEENRQQNKAGWAGVARRMCEDQQQANQKGKDDEGLPGTLLVMVSHAISIRLEGIAAQSRGRRFPATL